MPFRCEKCNKNFKCASNLEKHVNRQKPCIIEDKDDNQYHVCVFCNKIFTTDYNVQRHASRCMIQNNIVELRKHYYNIITEKNTVIEQKDALLEQKDELLGQKDELIEQLKNNGSSNSETLVDNKIADNRIGITGDYNSPTTNNDNSTTNNTTNNITNNNNNIHIHINDPYGFRSSDMIFMVRDLNRTDESFKNLQQTILKNAKNNDVPASIEAIMTYIHDNPDIKRGHNIRYCKEGKYKNSLLVREYDENDKVNWYVADLMPITKIVSDEMQEISKIRNDENDKLPSSKQIQLTKKEQKNIEEHDGEIKGLHTDPASRNLIFKIVKKFKISEDEIDVSCIKRIDKLGGRDAELSPPAKIDAETADQRQQDAIKRRDEMNAKKFREIIEKNNREVASKKQKSDTEEKSKLKKHKPSVDDDNDPDEESTESGHEVSSDSENTKRRRRAEKDKYDEEQRVKREAEQKIADEKFQIEADKKYEKELEAERKAFKDMVIVPIDYKQYITKPKSKSKKSSKTDKKK